MSSDQESADRQRWDELKALFNDAVERPRDDWPAVVDGVRNRDPALADELQRLLDGHQQTLIHLGTVGPEPLEPGAVLGPYVIAGFIGEGGMGQVYRARDDRLGRDVAIKVLHPDLAHDPDRRSRMEREARALAQLNHPNIVAVYDVGDHRGAPFIVSELLDGETLRERLGRADSTGPLDGGTAVAIVAAVADALGAAHRRGIVHRDIKPENIFLTSDGRTKVLDFGIAKQLGGEARGDVTAEGAVVGTLGYMAPEQLRGDPAASATDVYACGVVLYELLAGARPFADGSQAVQIGAILHQPAPPLSRQAPALSALVERCLDKRPEARFADGGELAAALRRLPALDAGPARRSAGTWGVAAALAVAVVMGGIAASRWWQGTGDTGRTPVEAEVAVSTAEPAPTTATAAPPVEQRVERPVEALRSPARSATAPADRTTSARPANPGATPASPSAEPPPVAAVPPTPAPTVPAPQALSGVWTVTEQIAEDVQSIDCRGSGALQVSDDDGLLGGGLKLKRDCTDARRGTTDSTESTAGLSAGTSAGDDVSFVTRVVDDGLATTCRYSGRVVGSTRGTMAGEVTCEARSVGVDAVLTLRGSWRATRVAP